LLFLEFNSLITEKGNKLDMLFGIRLAGEDKKLLEKIKNKRIKVSMPAVEIPLARQANNSINQYHVLDQPENQMPTPTRSAEVSLIGEKITSL